MKKLKASEITEAGDYVAHFPGMAPEKISIVIDDGIPQLSKYNCPFSLSLHMLSDECYFIKDEKPEACVWEECYGTVPMHFWLETSCGKKFGPQRLKECDFTYCPYCKGPIEFEEE